MAIRAASTSIYNNFSTVWLGRCGEGRVTRIPWHGGVPFEHGCLQKLDDFGVFFREVG